jgi:RNA-directed DNA polymerase
VLARLEATLVNCRRDGPQSQNRAGHADFRAHLAGQVAWVAHLHADKGKRLAALLAEIDWQGASES